MAKKEKQKICPICNEKLSFFKSTLKGGVKVCVEHTMDAAIYGNDDRKFTVEELKHEMEQVSKKREEFTKRVSDFQATKIIEPLHFNDNDRKILIHDNIRNNIIDYDDIISFEIIEDGKSTSSGGVGRALVGGALFGGAGAVVGAMTANKKNKYCESLRVKITIDDMDNPKLYVPFIIEKTKINSDKYINAYNKAQELTATLQIICNDRNKTNSSESDPTEEIKRYKELLDIGAITQEEFNKKKKELLAL